MLLNMSKYLFFPIIFCLILSCDLSTSQESLFLDKITATEQSQNSISFDHLLDKINSNELKNIHSVILIKDDKIILEEYFNGFRRDKLQYSASITKSFASTLIGIAIDKGYMLEGIYST